MLFQIDCGHVLPRRGPPLSRAVRPDTTSETDSPVDETESLRTTRSWTGWARACAASPCGPRRCGSDFTRGLSLTERVEADRAIPTTGRSCAAPHSWASSPSSPSASAPRCRARPSSSRWRRHVVLRRGHVADDRPDAPGRRRRLRRHDPLRPRVVRAVPDAAGSARRPDPPAGLHARPLDRAAAGGGAALQPRRVLLRRPGRDDEPPHQPVPLRAGHPGLGPVRDRRRPPCGSTPPPRTARSS